MGASIITGYTGTRHITPEMDGAVYRGIIGDDSYILAEGDQCEGSMPSVNQFTVKSGVVSIQGRQIYITQETLAIDTCPTGYKRIDLVCARFEHDTTSLIDQASLVVIKGAEVSGGNDPVEPAHNEGVIKDGATVVDFVMYRLDLDGANVEITKAATVKPSLYMLANNFIVEQGTSGGWSYRKWADGTAECWRIGIDARTTAFSATGNVFYRTTTLSLIDGFFISEPFIQVTQNMSNVGSASVVNATTTTFQVVEMSAVSTARTVTLYIYCIGRWK